MNKEQTALVKSIVGASLAGAGALVMYDGMQKHAEVLDKAAVKPLNADDYETMRDASIECIIGAGVVFIGGGCVGAGLADAFQAGQEAAVQQIAATDGLKEAIQDMGEAARKCEEIAAGNN
jgi:hypothetical protein